MRERRLLLVDDEPAFLRAYGRILRKAGYTVEVAQNGVEALEAFEKAPFEYVVTDVNMPRMDGLVLLERLQAIAPSTVVVIVTSELTDAIEQRARDLGARATYSKQSAANGLLSELDPMTAPDATSESDPPPRGFRIP